MTEKIENRGRVTIPTDVDVVPETLELLARFGADAIRDCDEVASGWPSCLKLLLLWHYFSKMLANLI